MHSLTTAPRPDCHTNVGVLHAHGELRVVALEDFGEGTVIFRLAGIASPLATRHTVQIAADEHLQVPEGTNLTQQIERYPWQFLNHACRPNTLVRGRDLVALRPIRAFEELSFDYETTEWQLAEPFACRCGECGGRRVAGFRFLDREERRLRQRYLAPHLQARMADDLPG